MMALGMIDAVFAYWPVLVGVMLAGILAGWLIWGRRTRVRIDRPMLTDAPPAPTLARTVRDPTLSPLPPVALSPLLAPPLPPAPTATPSELTRLKGIGPKLAKLLATKGVDRIAQIAAWTPAELAAIDRELGAFAGRAQRDQWIEQARLLVAGDTPEYEARFGKLDAPTP